VFGDDVDGPVPPGEAQQPVDVLVRVPLPQRPGRIASDRGVRGDIRDDYCSSRDDGAIADGDAGHDDGFPADPYVVSDDSVAAAVDPGEKLRGLSSHVPPKMKNGKAVEPIIGWFADDKRNLAPVAMAQNLPIISFSGPAV
jgi:hypothetical protein